MPLGHCGQLASAPNVRRPVAVVDSGVGRSDVVSEGSGGTMLPLPSLVVAGAGRSDARVDAVVDAAGRGAECGVLPHAVGSASSTATRAPVAQLRPRTPRS